MVNPYYESDGITIYHGDCREVLPFIFADLLITDPPYGVKMDKGFDGSRGFSGVGAKIPSRRYEQDEWDSQRPSKETFDLLLSRCKFALIFGGNYFADLLPQSKHWIVWDKLNTMPSFGDCELVWTNIQRNSVKKITRQYNGLLGKEIKRLHPTQKPVDLIEYLIDEYAQVKNTILDCFMGSGTTLVAAKGLGYKAIGVETEERYCEIAANRCDLLQLGLFTSQGSVVTPAMTTIIQDSLFTAV